MAALSASMGICSTINNWNAALASPPAAATTRAKPSAFFAHDLELTTSFRLEQAYGDARVTSRYDATKLASIDGARESIDLGSDRRVAA